tara:strand:- start:1566 stop:2402 length:837 start_codon:yes stop_codon:yes gene_type:complete
MGLGKTFTNSIVREIGRNYGKAASNYLLGDKHSTPIRMVGGGKGVARKRGRVYDNDFDKVLKKFEIKGAQATLNQVLNIHSEYFSLVEEANADNVIDLDEMNFLVQELPRGISVLERAKSALIDLGKQDFADKTEEKIESFKDFMKNLDGALKIEDLPKTKFNPIAFLFFFLSFIGLDRLYFYPNNFWSYVYAVIGISFPYWILVGEDFYGKGSSELGSGMLIYSVLSISMPFWYGMLLNPIRTGGYWQYRDVKKRQEANNKLAVSIKAFTALQIAKY